MHDRAWRTTTAHTTSQHEVNIFRTALRHIGRGFVEIAQGTGLIAVGTLRPVRSLVPSLVALASIAALTTATLVLVVTTVAQADTQRHRDNDAWTRWNDSPEIRFGSNTLEAADLDYLAEAEAWPEEADATRYVAWRSSDQ